LGGRFGDSITAEKDSLMTNYDEKPTVNVSNSGDGSTVIALLIAAIVLAVGAFMFFNYGYRPTSDGPKVVQNNTTLPAPVIETPAAPEVTTPTPAQPTTPPAEAPAANP
jgi:hypothetical protein